MTEKAFINQVAIVTGAGEGIGYQIARLLALGGASVVLNDLRPEVAQSAAQAISTESGARVLGVGGDVADIATTRGFVNTALANFGRLDVAVANAGLTLWGDFFNYQPEDFQRVLAVNLGGSFFLAQAAARQMREQGGGGRILLMSSVTGHQAIRYLSAYGMSKAAIEMLAKSLVVELAPHGITVNTVAPGPTLTPRNLKDDPDYAHSWGSLMPIGRAIEAEEIARAALFFLLPTSGHITGQSLVVDGGWSATSPVPPLDFVEQ